MNANRNEFMSIAFPTHFSFASLATYVVGNRQQCFVGILTTYLEMVMNWTMTKRNEIQSTN